MTDWIVPFLLNSLTGVPESNNYIMSALGVVNQQGDFFLPPEDQEVLVIVIVGIATKACNGRGSKMSQSLHPY